MAQIDDLTFEGLQTKDYNTLLTDIQTELQNIYGQNGDVINFDSNTPDGNFSEILAEIGSVVRELATEVYNSTDPDKCTGAVMDKNYSINFIQRNKGSFTTQIIKITCDRTLTLQGLDESYADINASAYAVSDDVGNIWYLVDTSTLYAGENNLLFRAKNQGEVISSIGTITNQVTIVGGVLSVINEVGYSALGTNQESDRDFRIRRILSVEKSANNTADSILAEILNIEGVNGAKVYQNNEDETDADGTPAHYIWAIVNGGSSDEIANILYKNVSTAGMRGEVEIELNTISGQVFTAKFDRPSSTALYIEFNLQNNGAIQNINDDDLKEFIVDNIKFDIGENATTSPIIEVASTGLLNQGGGAYCTDLKISIDNDEWLDYIEATSKAHEFVLDVNKISINRIIQ